MFFLEFGGRLPLGFELNLSYGSLLKGKTLFIGLKSGYIGISKTPNSISNSTIRMALLPVSAQIRIPISRRDLGFQYASPFEPIHETAKYFLSIDPGFTIPLSVSAISDYNRGGAMISLGVGGIFNFFESTNAVAYSGIDVQQLRVVNGDFKDTDYFVNFRIGVGANF